MLPWQPILGKICKMTFIQHARVMKRIRISQFQFTGVKRQYFATLYASLITIGPLTPEIALGVSVTFRTRRQKSAYLTKYLSKYCTELHQHFSIGRHMYRIANAHINKCTNYSTSRKNLVKIGPVVFKLNWERK